MSDEEPPKPGKSPELVAGLGRSRSRTTAICIVSLALSGLLFICALDQIYVVSDQRLTGVRSLKLVEEAPGLAVYAILGAVIALSALTAVAVIRWEPSRETRAGMVALAGVVPALGAILFGYLILSHWA